MIKEGLINISKDISKFISNWLKNKETFECRSFYGETFSLALLSRAELLTSELKIKLIEMYGLLDKKDSEFHWEFNNYAILDYISETDDISVQYLIEPLKFKNTPCTNWTLLRSNTRLKARKDIELALDEAKEKINNFQLRSGLILDDVGVKSFQYHCFSMAMIAEIFEQTNDEYFKISFLMGVEFIRNFILSNGETLYIGRGQNQSFGYGTLIYILSLAYKYTDDKTILGDLDRIYCFFNKFQRKDGSYPLILNGLEKSIPKVIDMKDEEFTGWYPYNNYFDYLPFMGYFISKSIQVLDKLDVSVIEYRNNIDYQDEDFIKIVKPSYEAVLSKTGGYWTNDMSIPFIVSKGKSVTPMYGGEQFQKSLYSEEGLVLPYFTKLKKSIRWRSKSFFINHNLWIISPLGIMKRKFIFKKNEIEIITNIYSIFKYKHIYLALKNNTSLDTSKLELDGYDYSASGKLKKYIDKEKISIIRIKIES